MPDEWYAMPVLAGRLIRLEPITVEHAPGYLAAAGAEDDAAEVFRWLGLWPPAPVEDARAHILASLGARARGERFAYAQVDAITGEVAGTSSYYEVNPALR